MTIQECYEKLNGNYNEMLQRMRSNALVELFAVKFLNDKSFQQLTDGLHDSNLEEAFRAAHTLKGVCANLSFTKLQASASVVTEFLRSGDLDSAKAHYGAVVEDYRNVVAALQEYKNSKNN